MADIPLLPTTLFEGTTGIYTFRLLSESGAAIPVGVLDTLTLTYYDVASGLIVNGRNNQQALNANDVTVATDVGPPAVTTVTWLLQPADTAMIEPDLRHEYRVIQFRWSWEGGTRSGAYQVQFLIENMAFVV
jgi:hypothetical protein